MRPGTCVLYSLGSGDAGYWPIRGIRWAAWGGAAAPGTGIALGANQETGEVARIPVTIRAGRLRRGCDGRLWYTRARLTTRGGSVTLRLASCPGPLPD